MTDGARGPAGTAPLAVVVGLWVLGAWTASCARQARPPGGPPDETPPVVVSTTPDTFAVVDPFDGPVVFRFSERISERPGRGSLEDAVLVSPATGAVEVRHGRSSLEVSLVGGFREGLVYRVRVRPVVQDMFDNPMVRPFELVFSTGARFHPGTIAGEVRDRITGETLGDVRVQAAAGEGDTAAVYATVTDEDGIYALRYLPPESYELTAFEDRDRDREPGPTEPRARREVPLTGAADTAYVELEVLEPDTIPARITAVEAVDSTTLRIETDDALDPAESLEGVRVRLSADEGDAPAVDSLLHAYEWEARSRALEARAGDTVPGPDTLPEAAEPDTAPEPRGPQEAEAPQQQRRPGEPPRAEREIFALLTAPLEPGVRHVVSVEGVRNIAGVPEGGGEAEVVWEGAGDPEGGPP